jgi:hypothetical protein
MKKILLIVILNSFISCNKSEVDGIKICNTLENSLSYSENRTLINSIEGTLNQDYKSLITLLHINCDGESGYDLGSVITQIIYKVGEDNFLKMAKSLTVEDKKLLKGFIGVGLEYGYPIDGKNPNQKVDKEFPKIYENLY